MQEYVVKACEPTALTGQSAYTLDGNDLMISTKVDTAHIVPGPIDIERFNDALARTLSVYPAHAGRLERSRDPTEPWKVRLSNDGVLVTLIDSDVLVEVPMDTIIQSPWTLNEGVNIIKYIDFGCEEPLMRVTIIRFTTTGGTSIGLSAMHFLGDGFVMYELVRLLSQNYQGLEPLDPPPTYIYDRAPPVSINIDAYGSVPLPDLDYVYPLREVAPHHHPQRIIPEQLTIRLTAAQVKQLHMAVAAQLRQSQPQPILSRQDVLAALLVHSISRTESNLPPIQHIVNIVMTRGIGTKPSHTLGNALLWAAANPAEDISSETIASTAVRIRQALLRARDPGFVAAFDALHCQKLAQASNAELGQDFLMRPGHMVINSTWKFDWTSAHFGFPGQTRFFHTLIDGPRYVKIFRPNPTLLSDGTWMTPSPHDAEITFFISKELIERFKTVFVAEAKGLGVVDDIVFVHF